MPSQAWITIGSGSLSATSEIRVWMQVFLLGGGVEFQLATRVMSAGLNASIWPMVVDGVHLQDLSKCVLELVDGATDL